MEEESGLEERVTKLEAEVAALQKLVAKLEGKLSKNQEDGPKRRRVSGDLSDRVSRGLKRQPDEELPRRQGPEIV